ncbi:hypothetical protein BDZ85DRAFT_248971 [Elsinoe ampelina]|uniref:Uncharacterized protein n=1 Tax=Elsinoe ampelina TaxID=302913 RepID=A0A6A6GF61_9PEZI|nr:hypothetical protein BDZ85DRAFT_248971 [Elsinoe ampelina]
MPTNIGMRHHEFPCSLNKRTIMLSVELPDACCCEAIGSLCGRNWLLDILAHGGGGEMTMTHTRQLQATTFLPEPSPLYQAVYAFDQHQMGDQSPSIHPDVYSTLPDQASFTRLFGRAGRPAVSAAVPQHSSTPTVAQWDRVLDDVEERVLKRSEAEDP